MVKWTQAHCLNVQYNLWSIRIKKLNWLWFNNHCFCYLILYLYFSILLLLPVPLILDVQLNLTSWSFQYLSNLFLKLFTDSIVSGILLQTIVTVLEKGTLTETEIILHMILAYFICNCSTSKRILNTSEAIWRRRLESITTTRWAIFRLIFKHLVMVAYVCFVGLCHVPIMSSSWLKRRLDTGLMSLVPGLGIQAPSRVETTLERLRSWSWKQVRKVLWTRKAPACLLYYMLTVSPPVHKYSSLRSIGHQRTVL